MKKNHRAAKKTTWFYQDEFHLMLKEEQTAAYSVEIWKRFRKWGGIPSGLTQNVKDLLASREIENILEQSKLETMIGDHLQDALIAVNDSTGEIRSVLAMIGEAGNYYEFSVYDSGVPFEINTLTKLGLGIGSDR